MRAYLLGALCLAACENTGPGDDDTGPSVLDEIPVGAFVITEFQPNPNASRPEFIEVLNPGAAARSLLGCRVRDGGTSTHEYEILESVNIDAGQRFVFASAPFLGASEGEHPANLSWGDDLALNQQDDTESVSIACPDGTGSLQTIDEVVFNWGDLDVERGRSLQWSGAADAFANDELSQWCPAPATPEALYATVEGDGDYGTPGADSICPPPPGPRPAAPGDVVISELLISDFDGLREWFEIHNPTATSWDLRDCEIGDAPAVGSSEPDRHTFSTDQGTTTLEPGGYLLLSKTDRAVTGDGSLQADYAYAGGITFNNSELQRLWIGCPVGANVVTIDEVLYDWGAFSSSFQGSSLSVDPAALSAEGNDDLNRWCLARAEDSYFTTTSGTPPETFVARGTPGGANPPCPVADPYPLVGELVITELMVASSSGVGTNEEWVEIKNVSGHPVGLDGCTLRDDSGDGAPDLHTIDAPQGLSVPAGDYAVLVKSSASDSIACGLPQDYLYGTNLSFLNDEPETFAILCPGAAGDTVIDQVAYDGGFTSGHSWQLRRASETAAGNDSAANWCNDAVGAAWTWNCTVDGDTNRGTPGAASTCN